MTAIPLPNGMTQFVDINGAPLVGGTVATYEPGGLTPKSTFQNYEGTIANSNPLTLDERGQAAIWGSGRYRQILKDEDGNVVWDAESVGFLTPATSFLYLAFSFTGSSPPGSSAFLGGFAIPAAATFPANFASPPSEFHANTANTSTYTVSVLRNGSAVGTLTLTAATGVCTFATSGGTAFTVAAGDRITLVGQVSADATLNNFFGTLTGTFT